MNDKIMISYKREEIDAARDFYDRLRESGLSPWLDESDIPPGRPWPDELRRQAMECDAMVALISKAYLASAYCRMELFVVRSRPKPVLPVLLDDCSGEFESYEETRGLGDIFFVRTYADTVVGLAATLEERRKRVVHSAATLNQEPHRGRYVYVSYGNDRAADADALATRLREDGINTWVATRDCKVGENWRQAQARGLIGASAQVLVLDEQMAQAEVLKTELILGEALGLRLFPIVPGGFEYSSLKEIGSYLEELGNVHHTFRRVSASQVFEPSRSGYASLNTELRLLVR